MVLMRCSCGSCCSSCFSLGGYWRPSLCSILSQNSTASCISRLQSPAAGALFVWLELLLLGGYQQARLISVVHQTWIIINIRLFGFTQSLVLAPLFVWLELLFPGGYQQALLIRVVHQTWFIINI